MSPEKRLSLYLLEMPYAFRYTWNLRAKNSLLHELFCAITGYNECLETFFFKKGIPTIEKNPTIQKDPDFYKFTSMIEDDSDNEDKIIRISRQNIEGEELLSGTRHYKGPCGHVFKKEEALYHCRNCALDDTCVLCSKCFRLSDHEGHDTMMSLNTRGGGCCDCGDPDAWKVDINCSLHSQKTSNYNKLIDKNSELLNIPNELSTYIEMTIERALDYVLDVLSCSPEKPHLLDLQSLKYLEKSSRLYSDRYGTEDYSYAIWAVILWNDENHTFQEVIDHVSRVTHRDEEFGKRVANRVDKKGRDTVIVSDNLDLVQSICEKIGQIKLKATIRCARDTFRENMCGAIIEWLKDISLYQIKDNENYIRNIICKLFFESWKKGTCASMNFFFNNHTSNNSYDNQSIRELKSENNKTEENMSVIIEGGNISVSSNDNLNQLILKSLAQKRLSQSSNEIVPESHWIITKLSDTEDISTENKCELRIDKLLSFDIKLWKQIRSTLRELYISTMIMSSYYKHSLAIRFSQLYNSLAEEYIFNETEPDQSIINFSVQLFTVPDISLKLVQSYDFLTSLHRFIYTFLTNGHINITNIIDSKEVLVSNTSNLSKRGYCQIFGDIRYILNTKSVQRIIPTNPRYLLQFIDLLRLFQGMNPCHRVTGAHVEYESESWISAFHLTIEVTKLIKTFSASYKNASTSELCNAIGIVMKYLLQWSLGYETKRFPTFEPISIHYLNNEIAFHSGNTFNVSRDPVSFHHPLHWLLISLLENPIILNKSNLLENGYSTILELLSAKFQEVNPEANENMVKKHLIRLIGDYPLSVCIWIDQIRAGLWVRNGISIKGQAHHYHDLSLRDHTYDKDIKWIQLLTVCGADLDDSVLQIIRRYDIISDELVWSLKDAEQHPYYDKSQYFFMFESLLSLFITLFSERSITLSYDINESTKKELSQILCFGPLAYSEIIKKIPENLYNNQNFNDILTSLCVYRPPRGLHDQGTYTLKDQYFDLVDPYYYHYSWNQQEEANSILKKRANEKGLCYEKNRISNLKIQTIEDGPFEGLGLFTQTLTFVKLIYLCLLYSIHQDQKPESLIDKAIYLCILSVKQEIVQPHKNKSYSFMKFANSNFNKNPFFQDSNKTNTTLICLISEMLKQNDLQFIHDKIHMLLYLIKTSNVSSLDSEEKDFTKDDQNSSILLKKMSLDFEKRKKAAKERHARIMAQFQQQQQSFLEKNSDFDIPEILMTDNNDIDQDITDTKNWQFPSGICIVCQEETNELRLYGSLGMIHQSPLLRMTPLNDFDFIQDVIDLPHDLDKNLDHIRPFGFASKSKKKHNTSEIHKKHETDEDCDTTTGFPPDYVFHGLFATSCGHLMHATCFKRFYNSLALRIHGQLSRNAPEDISKKEYLCPLCKSMGNVFFPIIWKESKKVYPGVCKPETSYEEWILNSLESCLIPFYSNVKNENSNNIQSPQKKPELSETFLNEDLFNDFSQKEKYINIVQTMQAYTFDSVVKPIASLLKTSLLSPHRNHSIDNFIDPLLSETGLRIPLPFSIQSNFNNEMDILQVMYRLLSEILSINFGNTSSKYRESNVFGLDKLWHLFSYTISGIETIQRGKASVLDEIVGSTLVHGIAEQSKILLRIISETIMTYITIGLTSKFQNNIQKEFSKKAKTRICQLFYGHPIYKNGQIKISGLKPILSEDIFTVLVDCSFCVLPTMAFHAHHLVRICYLAEVTKITITLLQLSQVIKSNGDWPNNIEDSLENFKKFVFLCSTKLNSTKNIEYDDTVLLRFKFLIRKYVLIFMRKVAILMFGKFGIAFPSETEAQNYYDHSTKDELSRLKKLMNLPTLEEIYSISQGTTKLDLIQQDLIFGWITHFNNLSSNNTSQSVPTLSLNHPAIFELLALPKHLQILLEKSMEIKCLKCNTVPQAPALCLFCGLFICSRSTCCSEGDLGECNIHMQKCGKSIGIYFLIKECAILFIHGSNGSFTNAPYLDAHGETDFERGRPLHLYQHRYDLGVRNLFLQHSIPSFVARKLESILDTGGWTTL
ncbi:hypothetical protein MERGE_002107 [Pneumocystis wakefieldiae]|uniref:E3 ubiquitin-protein ligase n=1 Tax=Pneumocystis wakefieldiae TaxID=38082 RepID=A0A899FWY9_9ASCO|nr:hypothetical protein MERGE_002107 [Pneumocystis wakefieldiae]